MWFFWFLACCLTARPDDHGARAIKKKVKKYSMEDLRRELEALGVNIDMDMDGRKKRTKKELQKLLIRELKQLEQERTRAEGFTLPMDIPNDVKMVLANLDEFLDKELAEMESNEKREEDVKLVMNTLLNEVDEKADEKAMDSLQDNVNSTLVLKVLKEKKETEKMLIPEAGDCEDNAEQKLHFWCAEEDKIRAYRSIPRRRSRMARKSSRCQTL